MFVKLENCSNFFPRRFAYSTLINFKNLPIGKQLEVDDFRTILVWYLPYHRFITTIFIWNCNTRFIHNHQPLQKWIKLIQYKMKWNVQGHLKCWLWRWTSLLWAEHKFNCAITGLRKAEMSMTMLVVRSKVKVLLTDFFDCSGVVHHKFLPHGQ